MAVSTTEKADKKKGGISWLAGSSSTHLSPVLDASSPRMSDSRFFGLWAFGPTPVVCQELSGLQPQTEGCAVSFPTFELWDLNGATTGFLALQPVDGLL